ncbi:hypothetical protein C8F01DRAFT_1293965 [Mycena amicta]|nr:hypothetical protein C8F01DRAFT_1293965 [Mycena amicta]
MDLSRYIYLEMGKSGSVRFFTLFARTSNPRFGSVRSVQAVRTRFFGSNLDFGLPEPKVRFKSRYNPNLNPEPGFSSVRTISGEIIYISQTLQYLDPKCLADICYRKKYNIFWKAQWTPFRVTFDLLNIFRIHITLIKNAPRFCISRMSLANRVGTHFRSHPMPQAPTKGPRTKVLWPSNYLPHLSRVEEMTRRTTTFGVKKWTSTRQILNTRKATQTLTSQESRPANNTASPRTRRAAQTLALPLSGYLIVQHLSVTATVMDDVGDKDDHDGDVSCARGAHHLLTNGVEWKNSFPA